MQHIISRVQTRLLVSSCQPMVSQKLQLIIAIAYGSLELCEGAL